MTAQIFITIGLLCDIVGAVLVANEVVRVFRGPTTINVAGMRAWDGEFTAGANPEFETHEKRKRKIMGWGLVLLIIGFLLQGLGTWWPHIAAV